MARLSLRRTWLLAHRWLGLSLGLVLLVAALTGSLLVLAEPLDEVLHPELFHTEARAAGPLEPVLQRLRAEFGTTAAVTLRPPREPGESLQASVNGTWKGTVYLDAATGQELGRRGQGEGFFNVLFQLHSSLFADDAGRALLTTAALVYAVLLLSGVVLWWPARWRHAWTVKTGAGVTRALFDLHRVAGAVLGVLVLVSVLTGAYMAWRPISAWVTQLGGQAPLRPPVLVSPSGLASAPLDEAVARALAMFPDGQVGYVQVPAEGKGALRIRLRLPDDPHPNGLTSVWLHPHDAQVLAVHRWSQLDPGTRAYSWIYPLHIGELGGPPVLAAVFVAGFALSGYGFSGAWLWWRRRQGRR